MAKEFRVILRKREDGDGMTMSFPEMTMTEGCEKLAKIAMCEEKGLYVGKAEGFFLSFFLGTLGHYPYKIVMMSNMEPVFVFKERSSNEVIGVSLLPERIDMVITKHCMTEIIIKEE